MSPMKNIDAIFAKMPIVAIIRGVTPDEVVEVGRALIDAGIGIIEVPLNSPNPFESIARLSEAFPDCITGAGTVLHADDVAKVKAAGGSIIVAPNINAEVIGKALSLGMVPMPGFQTATEAFEAVKAGATYLKLFPASSAGMGHIKAIKAVLPAGCKILAVGGAGASTMAEWHAAKADGYGIGSELYQPGRDIETIKQQAENLVAAYRSCN